MSGKIYFVAAPGRVKIGFTTRPDARLAQLRQTDMEQLSVLAIFDGSRSDESRLHRDLAAFRLYSEWFQDCSEVRAAIDAFKADDAAAAEPALPSIEPVGLQLKAIRQADALADEIKARIGRGEPVEDLLRFTLFLVENIIAPADFPEGDQ